MRTPLRKGVFFYVRRPKESQNYQIGGGGKFHFMGAGPGLLFAVEKSCGPVKKNIAGLQLSRKIFFNAFPTPH